MVLLQKSRSWQLATFCAQLLWGGATSNTEDRSVQRRRRVHSGQRNIMYSTTHVYFRCEFAYMFFNVQIRGLILLLLRLALTYASFKADSKMRSKL